jgi:hypothetical protein
VQLDLGRKDVGKFALAKALGKPRKPAAQILQVARARMLSSALAARNDFTAFATVSLFVINSRRRTYSRAASRTEM